MKFLLYKPRTYSKNLEHKILFETALDSAKGISGWVIQPNIVTTEENSSVRKFFS